jgi:glycosyltransferase involved in cell wall biosynthesis
VTVRNAFDLDAPPGRRTETREALGLGDDDLLVLQPTRAVAHKNIPAALRLAEGLAGRLGRRVVFWLPGPAEDGYAATLAGIVAATGVPVLRDTPAGLRLDPPAGMGDAYAACDLVTFPSTGGEGFGQPVIESVWADRPLAVLRYPALDEITDLGFSFLPADDPDVVAAALRDASRREGPDPAAARNRELAQAHFSMKALERALEALLRTG